MTIEVVTWPDPVKVLQALARSMTEADHGKENENESA